MAAAAEAMRLPMLPAGPGMGLREFLLLLARESGPRCRGCYGLRLEATAREAAGRGFDGFSTTLVMSPYQDLEAIARLGEQVGSRLGLEFRFADLRGRYVESCERSRELELYRQDYCGCVFSSLERAARPCQGARLRRRARRELILSFSLLAMERLFIWFGLGLVVLGLVMVGIGALLSALGTKGGRLLPGDIIISRPGFTFVFPIATCLLLSILLTLILWAVTALRR